MKEILQLFVKYRILALVLVPLIVGLVTFYELIQTMQKTGKKKMLLDGFMNMKINVLFMIGGIFVFMLQFSPGGLFPPVFYLIAGTWMVESSIERIVRGRIEGVYENGIVVLGKLYKWEILERYEDIKPRISIETKTEGKIYIKSKEEHEKLLKEISTRISQISY